MNTILYGMNITVVESRWYYMGDRHDKGKRYYEITTLDFSTTSSSCLISNLAKAWGFVLQSRDDWRRRALLYVLWFDSPHPVNRTEQCHQSPALIIIKYINRMEETSRVVYFYLSVCNVIRCY